MKKLITIIFVLIGITNLLAQETFVRTHSIPVPEIENTGLGEIVAGVDWDGDGKLEIYAVNNMLDQGGSEEIPKLYKYEYNDATATWDSVWMATVLDISQQNSWGAVTYGDWDKDGKPEIIWGPANWLSGSNPNPPRILVYEARGDGSEGLGVEGFGVTNPNCQWTITDQDNSELRPFKWELSDIDSDGDLELCFADRRDIYSYGVVSVTDIPDDGNGSETWTLETSGFGTDIPASYDMVVIDNTMYLIHDSNEGDVTLVSYSNDSWDEPITLSGKTPGGSWKTASVVDIDNNGSKEIVVGGWNSHFNNLYLLQPDPFEKLKTTTIANFSSLIGGLGRFNGGAAGDIDQDGNIDIIFGTRGATPAAAIVRIEYQGGDITDSSSYTYQIIDSLADEGANQRFDIVKIANVDDDPYLEVVYSDGNQVNRIPTFILHYDIAFSVDDKTIPREFYLSQNFPNPFNPSTTIRFGLSEQSNVSLKIYDILGREVAIILDHEAKAAGSYDVTFDASVLASGTYIYKLTSKNFTLSKKMILLK